MQLPMETIYVLEFQLFISCSIIKQLTSTFIVALKLLNELVLAVCYLL